MCDQVRLNPACSAIETSESLEILNLASIGIILSRQQKNKGVDQTVQMHRLICAFVVRIWFKQIFS